MNLKHQNNGACLKCLQIINRYPGFYQPLLEWFKDLQAKHPEAHVSCAGRGEDEQEAFYIRRASKARFGQSAHNFGAALDLFENAGDLRNIYEIKWFRGILEPNIPSWMKWYGTPGSMFYELPHVEVRDWRRLVTVGKLVLVESPTVLAALPPKAA